MFTSREQASVRKWASISAKRRSMKRTKSWLAVLVLVLSLGACGDDSNPSGGNSDNSGSGSETTGYN